MGNPEHLMDKHKQAIRNSIRSCKEKADNNPNNKRAVAMLRTLIKEKYTSPEHLYAEGGSAGGLLMGVVLNMAPELYHGVIAQVPFVDVATTMLDDTIPLTTGEYDQWGNPNDAKAYSYIRQYSPYDNIKKQKYPNT